MGNLFDGGAHMAAQWEGSVIMAISATAPNKEGAWEFIRYMLSEEAQGKYYSGKLRHSGYPMNKEAFDKCAKGLIECGSVVVYPNGGRFYRGDGMSEYKELEEVVGMIENRVQLYLEEHY